MGAFQNIYDPTERGGIKMLRITDRVDEKGNIMRERMLDRLMETKISNMKEKYGKILDPLNSFEDKLEETFATQIMQRPFASSITEKIEIDIPFSCEKEKELLTLYICANMSEREKIAEENGIDFHKTLLVDNQKKKFTLVVEYTISNLDVPVISLFE